MTRILILSLLLLFILLSELKAQEDSEPDFEYIPLEKFAGDTIAFLNHNFYFSPPNFYKGKTIEELLEYANLPHKQIYSYRFNASSGKTASVQIVFKDIPHYFQTGAIDDIDLEKKTYRRDYGKSRRNPEFVFLEVRLEPMIPSEEFYDKNKDKLSYTVGKVRLSYEHSQLTPPTRP